MKKILSLILSVSLILSITVSCSVNNAVPTYCEMYENALNLSPEEIEEKYPQLSPQNEENDVEVIEKQSGAIRWELSEQEGVLLDYTPTMSLNYLEDKLVSVTYDFYNLNFESAYPIVVDLTNDIIEHYGEPIMQSNTVQQPWNWFKDYEEFEEWLNEIFEEKGDTVIKVTYWYLSEMDEEMNFIDDSHNYQIWLQLFVNKGGYAEVSLQVWDRKFIQKSSS